MPSLEPLFVELLWRGLLLAGGGWLVGRCLKRGPHRWRHGLSLFFLSGLFLLPISILGGWRWELPLPSWAMTSPEESMPSGGRHSMAWFVSLLGIWATGFAVQVLRLGSAHRSVGRLKREAIPWEKKGTLGDLSSALGLRRSVALAISPTLSRPIVCGLKAPTILLPDAARGWSRNRLEWVLAHELAHVRRRDLWIQAGVRWLCAFYWINPFVWLLARVVGQEREVGADELAVSVTGNDRAGYARDLLCLVQESRAARSSPSATGRLATAAMLGATSSKLEDRVRALMRSDSRGSAWVKTLVATGIMAVVVWVSCCLVDPLVGGGGSDAYRAAEWDVSMRLAAEPFPAD